MRFSSRQIPFPDSTVHRKKTRLGRGARSRRVAYPNKAASAFVSAYAPRLTINDGRCVEYQSDAQESACITWTHVQPNRAPIIPSNGHATRDALDFLRKEKENSMTNDRLFLENTSSSSSSSSNVVEKFRSFAIVISFALQIDSEVFLFSFDLNSRLMTRLSPLLPSLCRRTSHVFAVRDRDDRKREFSSSSNLGKQCGSN